MEIDEFSKEEFKKAFDIARSEIVKNFHPVKSPTAHFTGGQPGSGKTKLADLIVFNDGNTIYINGDEYRKYHPRYKEICEKYGKDAPLHTQKFSGKMIEAMINSLGDDKYNLIIEGTIRTSEVPINSAKSLQEKGYKADLHLICVKPEKSYLGTLLRYETMRSYGLTARATPKEHHDKVVANLPLNVEKIKESMIFDKITVYNRSGDVLYNSKKDKNTSVKSVFLKEFNRPLNAEDKKEILQDYDRVIFLMEQRKAGKEEIEDVVKEKSHILGKNPDLLRYKSRYNSR